MSFKFLNYIHCDAATPWQLGFQDPATVIMEGIIDLHHNIFFVLTLILFAVVYMVSYIISHFLVKTRKNAKVEEISNTVGHVQYILDSGLNKLNHGSFIEIVWTIIPALILLGIAVPSFSLLYAMDEVIDPVLTVKVIGHQWYWSYEYNDQITKAEILSSNDFNLLKGAINPISNFEFDSYIVPEDELEVGQLRLLEVDNPMVVPSHVPVRLLITADDVLHCWAVPSLGVKVDAVPGRLNEIAFTIDREGTFYGQCSELCGVNHGFMPIVVKAVPYWEYFIWSYTNSLDS